MVLCCQDFLVDQVILQNLGLQVLQQDLMVLGHHLFQEIQLGPGCLCFQLALGYLRCLIVQQLLVLP